MDKGGYTNKTEERRHRDEGQYQHSHIFDEFLQQKDPGAPTTATTTGNTSTTGKKFQFFIISPTVARTAAYVWIKRHLPTDGSVKFRDISDEHTALNVLGPRGREVLQKSSSLKNCKPFMCKEIDVGYAENVRCLSITHAGEDGFVLYIPNEVKGLGEILGAVSQNGHDSYGRIPIEIKRMAADYVRAKLTSFTEVVFPNRPAPERRQHHMIRPGNELVSSLSLQMSLYFNVFFFPFWIVTSIIMLELKFSHLDNIYRFVVITVYVVMSGVEIVRLYLGYLGNLQERVPEVAGFWLLTLVLQLPLIIFLLATNKALPSPLERSVHFVQLTFILFQAVSGYFALRRMTHHQIMKFHLQQFDDIFGHAVSDGYHPMT